MKTVLLSMLAVVLLSGVVFAAAAEVPRFHVQTLGVGDSLDEVFKTFGPPQAMQTVGRSDTTGMIQILYFRGEDSLAINVSDLPENKVVQIELTGPSWTTDAPVKVGDRYDRIVNTLGKPEKTDDLSTQKQWMLEQAGPDSTMRRLIERNSGDTGSYFPQFGLYVEYDRGQGLVKSVRIYDPFSKLTVNINKI